MSRMSEDSKRSLADAPSRKVGFIIPWHDRRELAYTFALNKKWLETWASEILVVNCGGNPNDLHAIIVETHPGILDLIKQVNVQEKRFNKSLALNIGLHLSKTSLTCMLDADVYFIDDDFAILMQQLDSTSIVTVKHVFDQASHSLATTPTLSNLAGKSVRSVERRVTVTISWRDNTQTSVEAASSDELSGSRAGPGILLANRDHLLRVNGFNSSLQGWGWEDLDIILRLTKELGITRIEAGRAFHVAHTDSKRDLRGRSPRQSSRHNLQVLLQRYSVGNFNGTMHSDVEGFAHSC